MLPSASYHFRNGLHSVPTYRLTVMRMRHDDVNEAWVPAACTLPNAAQPIRVAEFDDLFAAAVLAVDRPQPTRLRITLQPARGRAELVQDLARRETECCSFFDFTVTERSGVLLLDVVVPAAYAETLDAIVERAARVRGRVA